VLANLELGFMRGERDESVVGNGGQDFGSGTVPKGPHDNSPTFQRWVGDARTCTSPEGTADSLPEVALVKGDTVLFQQGQEFLLERHFAMMRLLFFDVLDDLVQLRNANAEGTIFYLPFKQSVLWKSIMDPFG